MRHTPNHTLPRVGKRMSWLVSQFHNHTQAVAKSGNFSQATGQSNLVYKGLASKVWHTTTFWQGEISHFLLAGFGQWSSFPLLATALVTTFLNCLWPLFRSESKRKAFHMKVSCIHIQMMIQNLRVNRQTNFLMCGFAQGFALKQRLFHLIISYWLPWQSSANTTSSTFFILSFTILGVACYYCCPLSLLS